MIIASVAILLILMHFRSAVLICMTLPLAVLVSFILMRHFNIASNIMSLSGIAISIGILVDQAIVMVENATHHLTAHFGPHQKITGDTREIVIPACRTVGRPIFFSVMIILLSFIPVFALTGREGKTFHPLAFTKSFAMIGVAILSITLVPALIPSFIKGRLRSEEESWLVRNMIGIYKPWLTWLMPRRNLAMWSFSALLIVGAGLFPLDAVVGHPVADCASWPRSAVTMFFTIIFIVGTRWQVLSFVTLGGAWRWRPTTSPKIGTDYMPPLDEGSILDMPVTVPRASVTEAADDLKARDALLRRFPEVEMVVGKAGRADTPTDPSPLDMVESVITLRPKEYWPKRKLEYKDAEKQTAVVLAALQERQPDRADRGGVRSPRDSRSGDDERHDAHGRDHARTGAPAFRRVRGGPRPEAAPRVHRRVGRPLAEGRPAARAGVRGRHRPPGRAVAEGVRADPFRRAGQEDVNRLIQQIAEKLAAEKKVELNPELLTAKFGPLYAAYLAVSNVLGVEQPTLFTEMFDFIETAARRALARAGAPARSRNLRPRGGGLRPVCHRGTPQAGRREGPLGGEDRTTQAERRRQLEVAPRGTGRRLVAARCSSGRKSKDDLLEGNGQRGADARLGQHLDPADHQPHRHAGHRRADHDRREGLRQRPGQDPGGLRTGRRGAQADSRRGGRVSRPKPRQGLPGNQDRPRPGGPLRRQRRRRSGRDRDRAGRQGDHDDRGRTRAIPRAGPLRPRLPRGRGGREEPAGQCGHGADGTGKRRHEWRRDGGGRQPSLARRPHPRRCKSRWRWSPT